MTPLSLNILGLHGTIIPILNNNNNYRNNITIHRSVIQNSNNFIELKRLNNQIKRFYHNIVGCNVNRNTKLELYRLIVIN
jgi:hypothetical protein